MTIQQSDYNLDKITTKDFQDHLKYSFQAGSNLAVFGRRGSGKTMIAKKAIADSGMKEVYINLSVFERVDLGGYPDMFSTKEKEEKFVNYILPKMYESMIYGDRPVVALLDEVDKADQSLWAPLLELTNLQSIGGRKLPHLRSCVMTGNLISEGGARPSLPLLDRTEKYLIEANAKDWLDWAVQVPDEIHPAVYQFVRDDPNRLQGELDAIDYYADESPRGWHLLSKVLFFGEKNNWPTNILHGKVSGYVGKKAGLDFKMYLSNYKTLLPIANRVFEGESDYDNAFNDLTPSDKIYLGSIIAGRFASHLDASLPESPPKSIKYVGQFMDKNDPENILLFVRNQILIKRLMAWKLDHDEFWGPVLKKAIELSKK